ncbi:unnamed protein product [Phaedon cochleariae]|uniref:DUF4780 domain-containing protein n=1 Tax=Phaedon cochleariae TaxID=80249 RepID=A0A9N9SHL3_PHACE|nr:unnamed protein product [Phaedon cochleariae]
MTQWLSAGLANQDIKWMLDFPAIPEATEEKLLLSSEEEKESTVRLPKPEWTKLNGAARKRFKWLVKGGHSPEEARLLALKPIAAAGPSGKPTSKRNRSEGSTPDKAPPKRAKNIKGQVAESVEVGIVAEKFPEALLRDVKPSFLGSTNKPGYLVLTCANEATSKWLIDKAGELTPWTEASLRVLKESDIPHAQIVVGYFPASKDDSTEEILGFVEAQNKGLNSTD